MPRKPIPHSKQPIPVPSKPRKGFAAMDPKRQLELARAGGKAVPDSKRSFSRDHDLASRAGRKGGQAVRPETRSFSRDHAFAAEAGRKGGHARKPKEA
jgi:uncharacterized protein